MAIELAGNPEVPCRSCKAPIVLMKTAKGKNMPVDANTAKFGDAFYDPSKGHIGHFATCPDANQHRSDRSSSRGPAVPESHQEAYSANGGPATETINVFDDERDYS